MKTLQSASSRLLLTPDEMGACDRWTIEAGTPGIRLMERAGEAVFLAALKMRRGVRPVAVLCGPGNNGGDGYVAARLLADHGIAVEVYAMGDPQSLKGDAALAFRAWTGGVRPLAAFVPGDAALAVDALFGAGLDRAVEGEAAACIDALNVSGLPVLAVDLPSGVNGTTGRILGTAVRAVRTVTFCRAKPGHYLADGRLLTGRLTVADIGIAGGAVEQTGARLWLSSHGDVRAVRGAAAPSAHKYDRGAVAVCAAAPLSTGAARLASLATLKAGAGLATVIAPQAACRVLAPALTSVMVVEAETNEAVVETVRARRCTGYVIGPGFGVGERLRGRVEALAGDPDLGTATAVLDADALTAFAERPERLFTALSGGRRAVLTPHLGEFRRLFPDLVTGDKIADVRAAAKRANVVVLLKGHDTVVAAPDGRAVVNATGAPALATAGSGDVLSGIVAALAAGSGDPFAAAVAGAHLHGLAGALMGEAGSAEDLLAAVSKAFTKIAAV